MPVFGATSKARLATCDPILQEVLNTAIKRMDFSVLSGYRGEAEQNLYFETGVSKKKYPNSKHNATLEGTDKPNSEGVDVAPYPIDWENRERFVMLAYLIIGIAWALGYEVFWGGDWDNDDDLHDQTFMDLGHLELRLSAQQ